MTGRTPVTGLVRNVRVPEALVRRPKRLGGQIESDCRAGDLVIRQGRVWGLQAGTDFDPATARLVLPWLAEPHCHLDKCHTIARMPRVGGDLAAALAVQASDRINWSEADIRNRAGRGLDELRAAGCKLVRSHIDWTVEADPSQAPLAWEVLTDLADDTGGLDLDLAALVGIEDLARPGIADAIARRLSRQNGTLGAFVLDQPERRDGLRAAFAAADRRGLALDFHVDEGLKDGLDGLEMIADAAIATGFEGPILCGHACSLMNRGSDDVARIGEKLATAGISVAVLPTTNLYLQGRNAGTPDRRGLTRVRELRIAGVNVIVGTDNVADAFCPLGRFDPIASLGIAALAAQLDPPFARWLPMVTTGARTALGRSPVYVDGADIADLMVINLPATSDLLAGAARKSTPISALLEEEAA